jgi:hypothetical protein
MADDVAFARRGYVRKDPVVEVLLLIRPSFDHFFRHVGTGRTDPKILSLAFANGSGTMLKLARLRHLVRPNGRIRGQDVAPGESRELQQSPLGIVCGQNSLRKRRQARSIARNSRQQAQQRHHGH